jgi:hypothetical protein
VHTCLGTSFTFGLALVDPRGAEAPLLHRIREVLPGIPL